MLVSFGSALAAHENPSFSHPGSPIHVIRFVYFDLGNVLVGFSHERAAAQLAGLCHQTPAGVFRLLFDSPLQADYERGKLDTSQVCARLREELDCDASNQELETAIADIFWPLEGTRRIVDMLRSSTNPLCESHAETRSAELPDDSGAIRLGILSNTCDAHWRWVIERTVPWIREAFPLRLLSFELGLAKPEPAIYRAAIAAAGVTADEILFIDDRPENVAGALECGIRAIRFVGPELLEADLRAAGLLAAPA